MKFPAYHWIYRLTTALVALSAAACGPSKIDRRYQLNLATFELDEYPGDNFDRFEVGIQPFERQDGTAIAPQSFEKGHGKNKYVVLPGSYHITIDYYLNETRVLSADACTTTRNNEVLLVPGHHETLAIRICKVQTDDPQTNTEETEVIPEGDEGSEPEDEEESTLTIETVLGEASF